MAGRLPYLKETPAQTAGPYVHIGLAPATAGLQPGGPQPGAEIAAPGVSGRRIRIEGTVLDADGAPVRDAVIEVWQADAAGRYPHPEDPRAHEVEPGFNGWGRVVPDLASGRFAFETIKPGPIPGPNGGSQAPHLTLWLVARGINIGLHTRLCFADEDAANAACPVLARIEPHRRPTLLAAPEQPGPPPVYRFDIHLAGPAETVFLDI
ncbi:MAG TPA: protocatechuate 3,4-dioxygenase subunit alpha [Thermohalobaculum sp.]|nr:protocatechuate 3,4-dioxygenase subunit alpha [Thermohalobaculum sp.]